MRGNWLKRVHYENPAPINMTEGLIWIFMPMIILFSIIFIYLTFYTFTCCWQTVNIYRVEKIADGNYGNSYYNERFFVYTDKGKFECSHSALFGVQDKNKVFNKLEAGKTYVIKLAGWTSSILNWFPNIISATKIE